MPVLEKLAKHKHIPVAIIFSGACALGVELANLLVEQGSFVIVIDEYSQKKKHKVRSLLDKDLFAFIDVSGTASLADSVERIDYIFCLNHDIGDPEEEVSTSEFLEKSNTIDTLLQLGVDKQSKFLLTSSIRIHEILQAKKSISLDLDIEDEDLSYTVLEVQRYAENLTWEYYKKSGLDARIVRVGEILGEGIDFDEDRLIVRYIKNAMRGQKLIVEGDGLENLYFVHVLDAAYGLIKAQFTPKTEGQVYSLTIPRDITVLNLAYKILDLEPRSGGIEFVDKKESSVIEVYKPATNLKKIGWKPKISFERALAQTIGYAYNIFGKKIKEKSGEADSSSEALETNLKEAQIPKKKRSLKDFLINFFFEVKEETPQRSVLDSVQYKSCGSNALKGGVKKSFSDRVFLTGQKKEKQKYSRSRFKLIGWKILDFFEGIKRWIGSLTIASLLGYIFVFALTAFVYIFFLVPVLRIFYYGGVSSIRINSANSAFEEWQFSKASMDLNRASFALTQVDSNLNKISYLSAFEFFDRVKALQSKINKAALVLDGASLVAEAYVPLEEYMGNYRSNVSLEGNDALKTESLEAYNLDGLSNIDMNLDQAEQMFGRVEGSLFDESYSIPLIKNQVSKLLNNLQTIKLQSEGIIDFARITPSLLGQGEDKTTTILLLDNNSINTKGGKIKAACAFTIKDGVVQDIKVFEADDLDVTLTLEEEKFVRDDLKLLYPEDGLQFSELTLISDDNTFMNLVSSSIESKFNKRPDQIIIFDSTALKDIISLIGGVDLSNGKVLNSSNFEEVKQEKEISYKEILAKIINRLFEFKKEDISAFGTFCQQHLLAKSLQIYTKDETIKDFLLVKEVIFEGNDISEGFKMALVSDSSNVPFIKVESKGNVGFDDIEVEYKIEFEKAEEKLFSGTAFLTFNPNFEIIDIQSLSSGVELASGYADKVFVKIDIDGNESESLIIKGKILGFVKTIENGYNYNVVINKPNGFFYNYSYILEYSDELNLISFPDGSKILDKTVKLEGDVSRDMMWGFEFSS